MLFILSSCLDFRHPLVWLRLFIVSPQDACSSLPGSPTWDVNLRSLLVCKWGRMVLEIQLNHIFFFSLVIIQAYTVELHDNHVMRGNTAVFKCAVPAYVKDYIEVTSWSRSTNELTSGTHSFRKGFFFSFTLNYVSLHKNWLHKLPSEFPLWYIAY